LLVFGELFGVVVGDTFEEFVFFGFGVEGARKLGGYRLFSLVIVLECGFAVIEDFKGVAEAHTIVELDEVEGVAGFSAATCHATE